MFGRGHRGNTRPRPPPTQAARTPSATNEPRQVTSAISHATIGGVMALPSASERVRDPLGEAAAVGWRPCLHRARGDRKRRAFADADQDPHQKQRREAAGKAR